MVHQNIEGKNWNTEIGSVDPEIVKRTVRNSFYRKRLELKLEMQFDEVMNGLSELGFKTLSEHAGHDLDHEIVSGDQLFKILKQYYKTEFGLEASKNGPAEKEAYITLAHLMEVSGSDGNVDLLEIGGQVKIQDGRLQILSADGEEKMNALMRPNEPNPAPAEKAAAVTRAKAVVAPKPSPSPVVEPIAPLEPAPSMDAMGHVEPPAVEPTPPPAPIAEITPSMTPMAGDEVLDDPAPEIPEPVFPPQLIPEDAGPEWDGLSPEETFAKQKENYADDIWGHSPYILYKKEELLDPEFRAIGTFTQEDRLTQFFISRGKDELIANAEKLDVRAEKYHMNPEKEITAIMLEAGIDTRGQSYDLISINWEGSSFSMTRNPELYGGRRETIPVVDSKPDEDGFWDDYARNAGFNINSPKRHEGVMSNEVWHSIAMERFAPILNVDDEAISVPFETFECEVPELTFRNNNEANEFISDVMDWSSGGRIFRFFNPLLEHDFTVDSSYRYSYEVQLHAMREILKKKGHKNPDKIIQGLLAKIPHDAAPGTIRKDYQPFFNECAKYFTDEDLDEIAKIYRRIGVQLLKEMAPYYED